MKKYIIQLVYYIGIILGSFCSIFYSSRLAYLYYFLRRSFFSGLKKRVFASFGKGALLSENVRLFHPERIYINNHTSVLKGCILECIPPGTIEIGIGVSIGEWTHITSNSNIKIGDGVLTGRYVLISDNSHGISTEEYMKQPPLTRPVITKGKISIEKNVWIGDRAIILGGVTIGEGAIIGANSVVTHDVPPCCVAVGIPAKVIYNERC